MSEIMRPMSFEQLLNWTLTEYKENGTVFGERHPYHADSKFNRTIFGRDLETPIGPAAGPNTQLTQNIIAAYYTGSRFFELKTVQVMDGDELAACINRPCIKADDECYNCEWSTELFVPQAMEEYIKAWFLLKVISKEFGLGSMDGFQFNISVGYDLAGIKSEKVDTFLNTMQHAQDSEIFKHCKAYLLEHVDLFEKVTAEDIESISGDICNSVTISTLHGCPPEEIEKIAMYLITEKGFHTFIKCNPTLLGYEYARKTMDDMGYDYIAFGDFHFKDDLQYEDAVPMLNRLITVCQERNLEFGVKITNTFPVDVKQNELPSEEMYMSGKSLYPLSISVANMLARDFGGKLRISYSGGADFHNIEGIIDAGIWPVTMATTILKPGGYDRLCQIAGLLEKEGVVFTGIDAAKTEKLVEEAKTSPYHVKAVKPLPSRKINKQVPLIDCFIAPCKEGCPIHQDITTYLQLVEAGKYEEAMDVITEKNPLPFITGTICAHACMGKCTRNFYEEPVNIRNTKLIAAQNGYDTVIGEINAGTADGKKVAVVGGGNVAMDAARTALRLGAEVHVVYRRSEAELPARAEEVHHAKEEGIIFDLLTNPKKINVDENGNITSMTVIKMELGEPDASGRRRPVEIPGSEFDLDVDTVIMALGTSPNPLIRNTTKGLDTNKHGCFIADENGQTSREGVFAGGDAVTGAATVILAMGAGKTAAKAMDEYIKSKN